MQESQIHEKLHYQIQERIELANMSDQIDFGWSKTTISRLIENVEKVLIGKRTVVEQMVVALLCNGHVLLEDVPGVGKTVLARAMALSINLSSTRLQCTPDLMPSDVTGTSVYSPKTGEFTFMPGPVFTNFLIADEINRATPRAQSSLLECMGEGRVSVDGTTHVLPDIFQVIATQNPVEMQGTFPLPEAQLDRFFLKTSLGYAALEDELRVIAGQREQHPLATLSAVLGADDVLRLRKYSLQIYIHPDVQRYIVSLAHATRNHQDVALGAGPRGTIALTSAVRALALVRGAKFVDPGLVMELMLPVLAHRIVARRGMASIGIKPMELVRNILKSVSVPVLPQ